MAERLKALVLKTRDLVTGPGVRIPLLPFRRGRLEIIEMGCVETHVNNPLSNIAERVGWRGGRAAEGGGLLNRCMGLKPCTGGSNPPLSVL